MVGKELKAVYREHGLAVGGKKAELLQRLYTYVAEKISTIAIPDSHGIAELTAVTISESSEMDNFGVDITDEEYAMMP